MNNSDNETDTPSVNELTTFLKAEGFYDPLMSDQEMLELYQAVSNSKNTATAEDEKRRILEETQIDDLCLNSEPVNGNEVTTNCSLNSEPNLDECTQKSSDSFDDMDVFTCVPTTHRPLPQISYKPAYSPPLYCNPKIKHLSFEEKKKLIIAYHKRLINIYDSHQRQSRQYAPLGKPIPSDIRCKGSLLRAESKVNTYEFEDDKSYEHSQDDNFNDIYISRSGRQTKRKLYNENYTDGKKMKSMETSIPQPKKEIKSVITSVEQNDLTFTSEKRNRAEKLFDSLVELQKKQDDQEKENDLFLKSLQDLSDEDDKEDFEDVQIKEPFIRRRVVPPSRGRGAANRCNKTNNKSKKPGKKQLKSSTVESSGSSSSAFSATPTDNTEYGTCPICSLRFSKDTLESHADQCIDSYEEKTSVGMNKIVCEKCDQVLPLDMEYELHVRDCVAEPSYVS